MKTYKMTRMSGKGDQKVCEWNEAATVEELEKIEAEFNKLQKEGYFAADLNKNELIDGFKPDTDILMIPRMAGGLR